ncbi:tyrosine-type recombinase/integrase [Streptomyces sp. NPDC021020]|uniref:tyrosine-type recombinase/integrase n=1 Tax=Streptomyces sp. NPDC021020 TaxID=3365109 RepID=UPI0037986B37
MDGRVLADPLGREVGALHVSENTIDGYRVAVCHHLIPGLGAHRLAKLESEHLERFYKKMQDNGSSAGTAHQAHRTVRAALDEARRRRHLAENPATIAKAPRLVEEEVVPYTVEEVQRLLEVAGRRRNAARWVIALALGLKWADVDFDLGVLVVHRGPATSTAAATRVAASRATARRRSTSAARRRRPNPAPDAAPSASPTS